MHAPRDICIIGAGATGGSLAVRLAAAGARVTLVARGAHGRAIRDNGLTLISGGERRHVRLACFERVQDAGTHDLVVVAVKAPDLPALATVLPALLKPQGRFMFAMNGIPWWFDLAGATRLPEALRIRLDPDGALARHIDPASIVGAVVQSSNEVTAPGIVRNVGGGRNAMVIGRPCGGSDASLDGLAALLSSAGYAARISADIRAEIWTKTLLAASAGPVAALTGTDLGQLTADPDAFALLAGLMREGVAIGRAFGLAIEEDVEARLAFYRGKPIRPSMLQDAEAGRPLEVQNSIIALARIATALGVDAPSTQAVSALVAMLATTRK